MAHRRPQSQIAHYNPLIVTKFRILYLYRNEMNKIFQSMQIWYKGRLKGREGKARKTTGLKNWPFRLFHRKKNRGGRGGGDSVSRVYIGLF